MARILTLSGLFLFSSVSFAIYFCLWLNYLSTKHCVREPSFREGFQHHQSTNRKNDTIVISFMACGDRFTEAVKLIKSVLFFTNRSVHFVIVSYESTKSKIHETMMTWKKLTKNQFNFELREPKFPKSNENYWMHLHAPCAAMRLFYPTFLDHLDAVIYVDVDTLLLGPVEELWEQFQQFDDDQIAALAPDIPLNGYHGYAKFPFYGEHGVNSGMILMNLTRMRRFNWVDYLTPIMLKWKPHIKGDQDIINIIFYFNSRAMHLLPCRYNFHPGHCYYGCESAASRGVLLIHGTGFSFYKDSVFMALYQAINEYQIGTDPTEKVVNKMDKYINKTPPSLCRARKEAFLKIPAETIKTLY